MVKRIVSGFKWVGIIGGYLALTGAVANLIFDRSHASTLTIPNSFSVGQVADPAAVNANFSAIQGIVNGGIDDSNWNGAGPGISTGHIANSSITTSKILDGTILVSDMASTALPSNTVATGTSTDVNLTTGEVVRATMSYTPLSTASLLIISFNAPYRSCIGAGGSVDVTTTLYVNGVSENQTGTGGARDYTKSMGNYVVINPPISTAFTIEVKDKMSIAGCGQQYRGAVQPMHIYVTELKK